MPRVAHRLAASFGSAAPPAARRAAAADLGFYAVQGINTFKNVGGQRRGNPLVQLKHLAPEMGPAYDFGDAGSIEPVVTGIGVGLEEASKSGEMGLRMRTSAVGREVIPCRLRGRAA